MALGTGLRKACRYVVRIGRSLVVLQMAGYAGCAGQVEVVVDVAVSTLARWHCMPAGERKTCGAMIKVRTQPGIRVVTGGAVSREAASGVARIARRFEI